MTMIDNGSVGIATRCAFHPAAGLVSSLRPRLNPGALRVNESARSRTKRRAKPFVARAALRPLPCTSQATSAILTRLSAGIAGTAVALALSSGTISQPPITVNDMHIASPALAESAISSEISPSSLSKEERKALREESRRNTRAAGKVAQNFSLARRQATAGDLDAALSTYNAIIEADPEFAPAYSNRGNLYAARKKFDEAVANYDRSLQLAPLDNDSWVIYVNRGVTKLARGDDPYLALADLNVANELRAENDIVLSNRAGVWEMMGKWDNAIRDYQTALKSNDVQPFWERYGLVLFQRNKSYEALAILKRVAARFNVSDVHAAMAVIHFDRGEVAEAETQWSLVDRPKLFESRKFLVGERKWPPRAVEAMENFRQVKE